MSGAWPKFRVFVVKDGMASGLLIERQMSRDAPTEKNYYWLSAAQGLVPTEEIISECDIFHELSPGTCNVKFVELIVTFATFVHKTGKLKFEVSTIRKYLSGEKCQRIIDHFFERGDVKLRDFFIDAPTFKDVVLAKVTNDEELVGKAEEFYVLSPHDVVVTGHYLKPIAHVLNVGLGKSRWFRREGPIAADFDDGKIYRRHRTLARIREMLLSNHFSFLVGESATGKTVLVKQIGYELSQQENKVVYWFDGALERGFDKDQLIKEINGLSGIFIIENVHLETPKYQRVLYSINPKTHRHVLFTARPSFEYAENKKDRLFSELEHVKLDSSGAVNNIIEHFAVHHPRVHWTKEVQESIKRVCGRSLWLVSYALKGYVDADGCGDTQSWMEEGVKQDLEELERLDTAFPEVMVALSPLSHCEVLTDEFYLRNVLSFDQSELQNLVYSGDITRQDIKNGHVRYGLPHSALARLYWTHGAKYRIRRGIPDYDDFIYSYITSNVANGLEALTSCNQNTEAAVIARIHSAGNVADIVQNEQSMEAIKWAIRHIRKHHDYCENNVWLSDDLLGVLAKKIHSTNDLYNAADCLHAIQLVNKTAGPRLWNLLRLDTLAKKITVTDDFYGAYMFLLIVSFFPDDTSREFCRMINLNDLYRKFKQSADFSGICSFILGFLECDKERGYELWGLLNVRELARKMGTVSDIPLAFRSICALFMREPEMGNQLWSFVDKANLAAVISTREDLQWVYPDIGCVLQMNKTLAQDFCGLLELRELAARLSETPRLTLLLSCIDVIHQIDNGIATRLCSLLDPQKIACTLRQKDEDYRHWVLDAIGRVDDNVSNELRALLAINCGRQNQ